MPRRGGIMDFRCIETSPGCNSSFAPVEVVPDYGAWLIEQSGVDGVVAQDVASVHRAMTHRLYRAEYPIQFVGQYASEARAAIAVAAERAAGFSVPKSKPDAAPEVRPARPARPIFSRSMTVADVRAQQEQSAASPGPDFQIEF